MGFWSVDKRLSITSQPLTPKTLVYVRIRDLFGIFLRGIAPAIIPTPFFCKDIALPGRYGGARTNNGENDRMWDSKESRVDRLVSRVPRVAANKQQVEKKTVSYVRIYLASTLRAAGAETKEEITGVVVMDAVLIL